MWYGYVDGAIDTFTPGTHLVPFDTTTVGFYHYFVRIDFGVTSRILPVQVERTGIDCPNECLTTEEAAVEILVETGNWPFGSSALDLVSIINSICVGGSTN